MINELLSRYLEFFGDDMEYHFARKEIRDNHEVAWVAITYHDETFHDLMCQCDFIEGVGWKISNGIPVRIIQPVPCPHKMQVVNAWHLQLRQHYVEQFGTTNGGTEALLENFERIVLDLIEKVKSGEFVEKEVGSTILYRGHMYLQTVATILDIDESLVWQKTREMASAEKICLNGAIIQDFQKIEPAWDKWSQFKVGGYTCIANLPANDATPIEWMLQIIPQSGEVELGEIRNIPMRDEPIFGPSQRDIKAAEDALNSMVAFKTKP